MKERHVPALACSATYVGFAAMTLHMARADLLACCQLLKNSLTTSHNDINLSCSATTSRTCKTPSASLLAQPWVALFCTVMMAYGTCRPSRSLQPAQGPPPHPPSCPIAHMRMHSCTYGRPKLQVGLLSLHSMWYVEQECASWLTQPHVAFAAMRAHAHASLLALCHLVILRHSRYKDCKASLLSHVDVRPSWKQITCATLTSRAQLLTAHAWRDPPIFLCATSSILSSTFSMPSCVYVDYNLRTILSSWLAQPCGMY